MPRIAASERDAFYETRRSELARVALRLWAEHGYDQTPVSRIAEEAGVSKGSFYLYFETKDALLADVLRRNSLVPDVLRLTEDLQSKSLEEAVHGFTRGAWRHLSEHRDLLLVVMRELPTHVEEAQRLADLVLAPANKLLAGYLEERLDPERAAQLDLIITTRSLVGMILLVFVSQEIVGIGRTLPVEEDDITRTIAELFLRGVSGVSNAPGEAGT